MVSKSLHLVLAKIKHALSVPPFLLLFTSAAVAGGLITIKDSEAINHIGEKAEVRGIVSDVFSGRDGCIFITMGGTSLHPLFTGFVPAGSELSREKAFLKSFHRKEIGIVGVIELEDATPICTASFKRQIKARYNTAEADPIDYLNGIINDKYRRRLGLAKPVSTTELQEFKTYLDRNVTDWKDKDGEEIWRLFPKFRQASQ